VRRRLLHGALAGGLLLLGACSGQDTDTDGVVGPLDDPAYAFCQDTDAPRELTSGERETYCPLLDQAPEGTCPGLERACEEEEPAQDDPPPSDAGGCQGDSSGSSQGSSAPAEPAAPPQPPPDLDLTLSEAVGQVLRWSVAFGVALILGALLVWAARALLTWLRNRQEVPETPVTERPAQVKVEVPDADAVPDAPSEDLLSAARRALDEGRLADAVLLCRGAALRALGESGHLRLHASRTDREYVRALRKTAPDSQGPLRTVLRAVEQVRWGGRPITADDARSALAAATRLVALVLLVLGVLFARPAHAQPTDDYEIEGSAALHRVFDNAGFDVRWRLRTLRTVDAETDVLVLDASRLWLAPEDAQALRDWVDQGGILLVAGELDGVPELGALTHAADATDVRVARPARRWGVIPPVELGGGVYGYREAHGDPLVAVTRPSGDRVALAQRVGLGGGAIIGVADPRYLTNGALVAPANVDFLVSLVNATQDALGVRPTDAPTRVELATIAGAGSGGGGGNNPLASLANARLLPFVLQLLAVLALLGLWRGVPFGPPRDPPSEGRIRFADHARAWADATRARAPAATWPPPTPSSGCVGWVPWLCRPPPSGTATTWRARVT